MSRRAVAWIEQARDPEDLTPGMVAVLAALAHTADARGETQISNANLAALADVSPSTVWYALRELSLRGLITRNPSATPTSAKCWTLTVGAPL